MLTRSTSRHVNIARIDLKALRVAVTCAETGTLSGAAATHHMSVSGASHKLARLESALGVQIFIRGNRGLHLTPVGAQAVQHCRQVLSALDQLLQTQTPSACASSPSHINQETALR